SSARSCPASRRTPRSVFGGFRCPHKQQEFRAEMVALARKWFLRQVEKGKDPLEFPRALATFAARAVGSGRRVCGHEKAKDVMSTLAQCRQSCRARTRHRSGRGPRPG